MTTRTVRFALLACAAGPALAAPGSLILLAAQYIGGAVIVVRHADVDESSVDGKAMEALAGFKPSRKQIVLERQRTLHRIGCAAQGARMNQIDAAIGQAPGCLVIRLQRRDATVGFDRHAHVSAGLGRGKEGEAPVGIVRQRKVGQRRQRDIEVGVAVEQQESCVTGKQAGCLQQRAAGAKRRGFDAGCREPGQGRDAAPAPGPAGGD